MVKGPRNLHYSPTPERVNHGLVPLTRPKERSKDPFGSAVCVPHLYAGTFITDCTPCEWSMSRLKVQCRESATQIRLLTLQVLNSQRRRGDLKTYKRRDVELFDSSLLESQQPRGPLSVRTMVFKLAFATVVLAAYASAAHIKRVTCPDGNVTSHAAVCHLASS